MACLLSLLESQFLLMEHFSIDQSLFSLMDSVYLPDSPSYIPFNSYVKPEEPGNEFCFPSYCHRQESIPRSSSSSLTETCISLSEKPEESQKKQNNVYKSNPSKRKKKSSSEKMEMEEKNPPTDYIHVRARRGQATDSHSLAERERRERISKRMKILQDLVPGCEKVTGKALVLDEIINYVKSLMDQVEFLSMKLASVNPFLHEFGMSFDDFTSITENMDSNIELWSSMIQSSHIQVPGDNITVMASSATAALYGKGPTLCPQDSERFYMQVGDQTEALDHQVDLYSMCSFQQN